MSVDAVIDNYRIIKLLLEIKASRRGSRNSENFCRTSQMLHPECVTSIHLLLAQLKLLNVFAFLSLPRFLIPPSVHTLHCACERMRVRKTERLGTHRQPAHLFFPAFRGCFYFIFILFIYFIICYNHSWINGEATRHCDARGGDAQQNVTLHLTLVLSHCRSQPQIGVVLVSPRR